MSLRSTSTTNGARLRVNGASSAYSALTLNGDGAVAISQIIAAGTYVNLGELNPSTTTANTFTSLEVYLPNYLSSASKPLSNIASTENNSTTAYTVSVAGLCTTAAYNSIEIYVSTNAFVAGSSFYLYGIKSS